MIDALLHPLVLPWTASALVGLCIYLFVIRPIEHKSHD